MDGIEQYASAFIRKMHSNPKRIVIVPILNQNRVRNPFELTGLYYRAQTKNYTYILKER